jgi:hypothetical protein
MFVLAGAILSWFAIDKIIQGISGAKFSQKWSSNLVSATHSVITVADCWLALHDALNLEVIFVISASYFMYDIRNYPIGNIYYIHHICAIIGLAYGIRCGSDISMALACFMFTEIGNFPIYVMYCLHTYPNKVYFERWHDIVLVWEFAWFMLFRIIIVSWVLLSAVHPFSIFLGVSLQAANIKWAIGMYFQVCKIFKPVEVCKNDNDPVEVSE